MKKTGLLKLSLLLVLALTMVLGLAACQLKIESMDVVRGEFPEVFARYVLSWARALPITERRLRLRRIPL